MRAHIKKTAVDLFDRYGFENVSIEEIAQAAGCSVGNIYHYFKNKEELSMHMTEHVDAEYEKRNQDYIEGEGRSYHGR